MFKRITSILLIVVLAVSTTGVTVLADVDVSRINTLLGLVSLALRPIVGFFIGQATMLISTYQALNPTGRLIHVTRRVYHDAQWFSFRRVDNFFALPNRSPSSFITSSTTITHYT